MFLRVNICFVQDLPARKPACLSLSVTSTADLSLLSNIDKIFPGIDNKQIPLQLLQSVRFPFLVI